MTGPSPLSPQLGRDRLLDTQQLSRRWNLSPRSLERYRMNGEGPRYLRVGGAVRYRLADIEAFESEQLAAAQAERTARKQSASSSQSSDSCGSPSSRTTA
jgi:hypothetical protein